MGPSPSKRKPHISEFIKTRTVVNTRVLNTLCGFSAILNSAGNRPMSRSKHGLCKGDLGKGAWGGEHTDSGIIGLPRTIFGHPEQPSG